MGGRRISELQELTAPASNDMVPVIDISDTSQAPTGSTKRLPLGTLLAGPAAGVQITDTFDTLSSQWVQQVGSVAVDGGQIKANSLSPAGSWRWENAGLEDPTFTSPWQRANVDTTMVAEERPGGSGVQCCEMVVSSADVAAKYVMNYSGYGMLWGASYTAYGWVRKVSDDAYPIAVWVGEYGGDYSHTVCGSTLSTEWQLFSGVYVDDEEHYPAIWGRFPDDAPIGVTARVDDFELLFNLAIATRRDWYSEDVQIEAPLAIPASGPMTSGLVLRYEDVDNYILVMPRRSSYASPDTIVVVQVRDGVWQHLSADQSTINWTAGGTDTLRVRLQGDVLCVDVKYDGDTAWTENLEKVAVTYTKSGKHGVGLLSTVSPAMINSIYYSTCPPIDRSTAGVFQQTIYIPGTLTANHVVRFVVPFTCQILHASAVMSNAGNSLLKLGHSADDDEYLQLHAIGQSNVPVAYTAPEDFRYGIIPTIPAGSTAVVTVDFDGAGGTAGQNVTVVITYRSL